VIHVIESVEFRVLGRPAPQGSKKRAAHGQMREASQYLPAWRHAVKRATYMEYKRLGVIAATDLPLLRGPVAFGAMFWLAGTGPITEPPDLDKLVRAVWDALKLARLIEDDSRFVAMGGVAKVRATAGDPAGALIRVWRVSVE
jgi:crossover junction endodeoxyribonuclease RusA